LPTRVLDIESNLSRLYESQGEPDRYVALSYCWGAAGALTTTTSNIDKHRLGIPVTDFPRTLRQTIKFTQALGNRYLWIGALCIVQDDPNDWADQAAKMTEVYGSSTLTLSATSSYDCDHRLLSPPLCYTPLNFIDLDKHFLSTRGWTFQDRTVPSRTLHFTSCGVLWECSEGYQHEVNYRRKYYNDWNNWVCDYSSRKLTKIADKLPAIGGIAKALGLRLDDTYIAGIWANNFHDGLLWCRHRKALSLIYHKDAGVLTWSWAS
ncbi:heterokaryon incompatibility protein-domain-containing protein, partial [Stachybotrys elegans]